MNRWILLIGTNLLILVMLGIALFVLQAVLGVQLSGFSGYLVFALLFGFGGAFISLAISKPMAKWSTRAKVIENPSNPTEQWLMQAVARQARGAGIKMPEVAVYPSPEPNAFATGATKSTSLVAVSQGLLDTMTRDEVEAVLAHEVSHVANGDMVTMTLLQGTLNTFVFLAARAVGLFVDRVILRSDTGLGYFVGAIAAQIVFGLLASMVAMRFSRHREFRADAGAAQLESPEKMIAALRKLDRRADEAEASLPKTIQAFGISGTFTGLFSSHPPIQARIEALENFRQV